MYSWIKLFLFCLPAETAHHFTLCLLRYLHCLGLSFLFKQTLKNKPVECMGLHFKNPIGLAAGLDKTGSAIDALAALGFGFIEIGTVTPKPQRGNPRPRLFRLKRDKAILNRMGFNNEGVEAMIARVKRRKSAVILGINIGKNAATPLENAVDDYVFCYDRVYAHADYIVANISSPNTENLRLLQFDEHLKKLLSSLKQRQAHHAKISGKYKPLVIKVSPDLTGEEIKTLSQSFIDYAIDGVIATNTTVARDSLSTRDFDHEKGGVSGEPLYLKSTDVLRQFHTHLQGHIPLIGVGGIHDADSADEKFKAGANLIQLYTSLIFEGPDVLSALMED